MPTPLHLEAATRSLAAGETFYTYQRAYRSSGQAIAAYMTRLYGSPFPAVRKAFAPDRFFATVGGMHALQIAVRMRRRQRRRRSAADPRLAEFRRAPSPRPGRASSKWR